MFVLHTILGILPRGYRFKLTRTRHARRGAVHIKAQYLWCDVCQQGPQEVHVGIKSVLCKNLCASKNDK